MPIYKSTLNSNKNKKPEKPEKPKTPMSPEKKKKIICWSLIVFCWVSLCLLFFKNFIQTFYLGVFGVFAYPFFFLCSSFLLAKSTNIKYSVNKRYLTAISLSLFFALTILHLILTHKVSPDSYSAYLVDSYKIKTSGGGIILSLLTYPMVKYLTTVGAYVFTSIGLIISVWLTVDSVIVSRNKTPDTAKPNYNFNEFTPLNETTNNVDITMGHKQEELKRKIAKQKLGLEQSESSIISSSMHIDNITDKLPKSRPMSKREYILTPPDIVIPDYNERPFQSMKKPSPTDNIIVGNTEGFEQSKIIEGKDINLNNNNVNNYNTNTNNYFDKNNNYDYTSNNFQNTSYNQVSSIETGFNKVENFDNYEKVANFDNYGNATEEYNSENYDTQDDISQNSYNEENDEESYDNFDTKEDYSAYNSTNSESVADYNTANYDNNIENTIETEKKFDIPFGRSVDSTEIKPSNSFEYQNTVTQTIDENKNVLGRPKKIHPQYIKPPIELLNYIDNVEVVTDEECNENINKLEKVLDDFKIPAKVKAVQIGPAVTRYEIGMPTGISVKKVQLHSDDIAMALASNGGIRIEAPIPGKNAVGIEVPNKNITSASIREMIESLDYQKRTNPMSFVLGKDINGTIQFCNLDKMPHLLVAGSTGSGKSVCLNTMIISMLYKSSPEDLRFILIDPKTVEFSVYANLPHLLTPQIITTKEQAINALNWAIKEMDYRYTLLQQNEVVNIKEYNNLPIVKDGIVEKLPYIVIVIDELNDLMIDTKREMEERIMKLAQKSRAAGIHLVIATQRPSVDVITGTIKANLPSRIAFALTNFADSKTVLDMGGAEKLLGRGDMLYKPNDMPEPRRVQGAYITSQEVSAVVKFIKNNNPCDYDEIVDKEINELKDNNNLNPNSNETMDPILKDALRWFINANQASITMIQRRFGVGYARAARLVDQMEQLGYISRPDGSKPRQVLISLDEFNRIFN